jgi:hypothetical protein
VKEIIMETIATWILKKAPAWLVSWSFRKIFGKKDLVAFQKMLELEKRKKVSFSPEKWIFEDDNSFVIEISDESRDFAEKWTDYFPDKRSFAVEVFLKVSGEMVHTPLRFVAVDGYRYFVPCPEIAEAYGERYYYWDMESLEYKVFKIIGRVDYLFSSLQKFGESCGVKIK